MEIVSNIRDWTAGDIYTLLTLLVILGGWLFEGTRSSND